MNTASVFIVGGGPAGAAVALALAQRGLAPVVLEAQPAPVLKVGESLPPGINALLDQFDLTERLRRAGNLSSHGNRFLWGTDAPVERDFIYGTSGAGWRLDRRKFEEELARAAIEAGADWRYGCRLAACLRDEEDGRWMLEVSTPRGVETCRADFVVDASGRSARLARMIGTRRIRYDRLIGVAAYFQTHADAHNSSEIDALNSSETDDSFTLVEAISSGWWYSTRLPGGKRIAVFMTDDDLLDRVAARQIDGWLALLREAPQTAKRAIEGGARLLTEPRILPAHTARLTNITGEAWLAVGDAAVAHDPLASHGISMALGGGFYAASAISDYLGGRREALRSYAKMIDRAFAQYLLMRHDRYLWEQRWPHEPFWRRRHEPNFDAGATGVGLIASAQPGRNERRKTTMTTP